MKFFISITKFLLTGSNGSRSSSSSTVTTSIANDLVLWNVPYVILCYYNVNGVINE